MKEHSRRQFAKTIGASAILASPASVAAQASGSAAVSTILVSLNGAWEFRLEASKRWTKVDVPHTWQVEAAHAEHTGIAWYRREFDVPAEWRGRTVRIEFEAVYHTATVWVNDQRVGAHERKGYTAFTFDITGALRFGERNRVVVKVDNSFRDDMLPRSNSYDWVSDGGITRPVQLLVTPSVFIERLEVDADPDLAKGEAAIHARAVVWNASNQPVPVALTGDVVEEETGLHALDLAGDDTVVIEPNAQTLVRLRPARLPDPRLWHFDHPNLYRLNVSLEAGGQPTHTGATTFGVRKIEVRGSRFYLNGERLWLTGVERMAGSNPEFGMAEPASWLTHDHDDIKELNCVFTRVHWPQDRRVLDYCDRHGMLMQLEVPSWGPRTFQDMDEQPAPAIMQNGLEQLREMIQRDRNHPCVFSWGLCNEVNGQHPPAKVFVRRMYAEARRLDPSRPLTYASNSLQRTPEKDVSGEMDFIMWNEYYESWMGRDVPAMKANLEAIHAAFPDKAIVISEYGYCECRPTHSGGDPKRIEVLLNHNRVFREFDYVAGTIFFDYNDYRTHIGDKGVGPLKQRVHGVVDLYGNRKPSFQDLRRESSPIEKIEVAPSGGRFRVRVRTRRQLPGYTLTGYKLRWIVFGFGDLPMERGATELPRLAPGGEVVVLAPVTEQNSRRVQFDVIRPTGFSAWTEVWTA